MCAEETFSLFYKFNASQGRYLPSSAEQKHFLADHNTRLSSSSSWRRSTCVDEMPSVLHWIEAVQVVEVKIENSIVAAKDVNQSVVDDCEQDNR